MGRRGCKVPIMGKKGRGVLVWGTGSYSVKYRDPDSPTAYKQQGIGRISAIPGKYCDGKTFISETDQTYEGIALLQADGFINMDFFEVDTDGNLIVLANEQYFQLDSLTGQLINVVCTE